MKRLENPVLLAQIGAPHGLKGEVMVQSFCADPMALADYGALYDKTGNKFKIKGLRAKKNRLVVKFIGINSREEAEAVNRVDLFVERLQLPDELEEDEFYLADLIGLIVRDDEGMKIGEVKNCYNFGAGDLIEITFDELDEKGRKRSEVLPFTKEIIPNLNISEGWVSFKMPKIVSERDEKDDDFHEAGTHETGTHEAGQE